MTIQPTRTTSYTGVRASHPANIWIRDREPSYEDHELYSVGDVWFNVMTQKFWVLHSKFKSTVSNVLITQGVWVITTHYTRDTDPLATDVTPYQIGDFWYNSSTMQFWRLVDLIYVNNLPSVATWSLSGSGAGTLSMLTGDDSIPVLPDGGGNINVQGGLNGIQFTSGGVGQLDAAVQVDGVSITINGAGQLVSSSSPLTWNLIALNTVAVVNNGYMANGGGQITVTLPAVFAFGDIIWVKDFGGNGVQILPAVGDTVQFFNTSVGVSLTSTVNTDAIQLVGSVANSRWDVISSQGNWNLV